MCVYIYIYVYARASFEMLIKLKLEIKMDFGFLLLKLYFYLFLFLISQGFFTLKNYTIISWELVAPTNDINTDVILILLTSVFYFYASYVKKV